MTDTKFAKGDRVTTLAGDTMIVVHQARPGGAVLLESTRDVSTKDFVTGHYAADSLKKVRRSKKTDESASPAEQPYDVEFAIGGDQPNVLIHLEAADLEDAEAKARAILPEADRDAAQLVTVELVPVPA